jgi:hypothetical protein
METKVTSSGISILTILGIVFLILRLCNVIDWGWVLVCLPFIIEGGLIVVGLIAYIILTIIAND